VRRKAVPFRNAVAEMAHICSHRLRLFKSDILSKRYWPSDRTAGITKSSHCRSTLSSGRIGCSDFSTVYCLAAVKYLKPGVVTRPVLFKRASSGATYRRGETSHRPCRTPRRRPSAPHRGSAAGVHPPARSHCGATCASWSQRPLKPSNCMALLDLSPNPAFDAGLTRHSAPSTLAVPDLFEGGTSAFSESWGMTVATLRVRFSHRANGH